MTNKKIRSVVKSDGRTAIVAVESWPYEDEDDCLTAAAEDYVSDHPEAAGWDLSPRWEDDSRERILLTVPATEAGLPGVGDAHVGEAVALAALAAMALDDTTRAIARDGITLTHEQADELGQEVLDWMRRRLDLVVTETDRGVSCVPRAASRSEGEFTVETPEGRITVYGIDPL